MLQAPAEEPEESCGKVKASGEASCSCRVSPQPAAASRACTRLVSPPGPKKLLFLLPEGPGSDRTRHTSQSSSCPPGQPTMDFLCPAIGVAIGIGLTAAMPAALGDLGFTKAGITAGSVAARLMSLAAMANGGRVAAGSLVAIAQLLEAAGVPTAVMAALSAIGAVIRAMIPRLRVLL
ncbi:uncharacterized protein M6G45_013663 [Spheniscus humboldti]